MLYYNMLKYRPSNWPARLRALSRGPTGARAQRAPASCRPIYLFFFISYFIFSNEAATTRSKRPESPSLFIFMPSYITWYDTIYLLYYTMQICYNIIHYDISWYIMYSIPLWHDRMLHNIIYYNWYNIVLPHGALDEFSVPPQLGGGVPERAVVLVKRQDDDLHVLGGCLDVRVPERNVLVKNICFFSKGKRPL